MHACIDEYIHWAFMKLVMGTGWLPSTWTEVSWKMASAWLSGLDPMYFCPRPRNWLSMGMDCSCSDRGIFLSFILCTSAWAEPSSTAAALTRAPFIVTTGVGGNSSLIMLQNKKTKNDSGIDWRWMKDEEGKGDR